MPSLHKIFILVGFCLPMISCTQESLQLSTPPATLSLTSSMSNLKFSNEDWLTQPIFDLGIVGGMNPSMTYNVSLESFSNKNCTVAAPGTLSAFSNPVQFVSNSANFAGLKYTNSGPLEDLIYLKATASPIGISKCLGPINILHHYNTGSGFSVFQNNGNGIAGADNTTKIDIPSESKLDSQGRIVVVGVSKNVSGGNDLTILRYNPNGTLDTTFGNGATAGLGYVIFQNNGLGAAGALPAIKEDYPYRFIIDSQGRYIIPGYSRNSAGGLDAVIWRYNSDGSLDSTFGNGITAGLGYVMFQPGGNGAAGRSVANKWDSPVDIAIDSQGRYVLPGYSASITGGYELVIWRYNSDGSLDTTFGNGATAGLGYVLFQAGGSGAAGGTGGTKEDDAYGGIIIDSSGRYVISGMSANAANTFEMAIWRYNSDGTLDSTFGSGATAGLGYVLFQNGGPGAAGALNSGKYDYTSGGAIDSLGRIIISGTSYNLAGGSEFVIWRYNSDGSLDTTFGNGPTSGLGYILFQPGGNGAAGADNATKSDLGKQLRIDSSGRYVIGGSSGGTTSFDTVIWRYNSDGTLDSTFGNGTTAGLGYVISKAGGSSVTGASFRFELVQTALIDSAGRYVLVGAAANEFMAAETVIWRYLPSGEIDQ